MQVPASRIREALRSLSGKDWKNLTNRLRRYVGGRWRWIPEADIDDMIHDAVSDALAGKRTWPAHIGLYMFLCGIIRSKYSHEWEKNKRRKVQSLNETSERLIAYELLPPPESPEPRVDLQQLHKKLRELVADDSDLRKIVDLWIEDSQITLKEVVEMSGLTEKEVKNAKKRLDTKLRKWGKEWWR